MRKAAVLLILAIALSAQAALARDVKFEVSLDRNELAMGESAQMGLTFYGTQSVPAPDIDNIDGLDVRYLGPSTMMTVINGKVSSSVTHMYRVMPLRTGKFQLGPYKFTYNRDDYASNIIFLVVSESRKMPLVRKAPAKMKEEEAAAALPPDVEDRMFLVLSAAKTKAYVNELVPVMVKLYVNRLNVSDIQLPTFAQEGFSKAEFKEPRQYREEYGGVIYDVLEFRTKVFGTRPGEYKLGPAKIKANIVAKRRIRTMSPMDQMDEDDFFDNFLTRYEKMPTELKSDEIPFTVAPLPQAGRPADFSGAVGDYQFIYSVSPKKVKVGDPITLKMEINGTGNANTVLMPKLDSTAGFKVYEAEVKTEENHKTFTQVLIPETDEVTQAPRATFNYFDPSTSQYKTITQGPVPIQVEKAPDQAPAQVIGPSPQAAGPAMLAEAEEPRRDIIYIKDSPDAFRTKGERLYKNKIFLAGLGLPLLLLAACRVLQARRLKFERDTKYAGRVSAARASRRGVRALRRLLKSQDQKAFYEAMFKTLQAYLGGRLNMPPAGLTYDAVEGLLLSKEANLEVMRKIKKLFDVSDQARFALTRVDELSMKNHLEEIEEIISYLERMRP